MCNVYILMWTYCICSTFATTSCVLVRITENLRKLSIIIIIDKVFMVSGH